MEWSTLHSALTVLFSTVLSNIPIESSEDCCQGYAIYLDYFMRILFGFVIPGKLLVVHSGRLKFFYFLLYVKYDKSLTYFLVPNAANVAPSSILDKHCLFRS